MLAPTPSLMLAPMLTPTPSLMHASMLAQALYSCFAHFILSLDI